MIALIQIMAVLVLVASGYRIWRRLRYFLHVLQLEGYKTHEFFSWLKKTGIDQRNFYIICGDRHWQYHSIHPTGIEEFSCGALVDANSRLGRKQGDPKSTDPKGLIKQAYAQSKRSGGFLAVTITPAAKNQKAALTFAFRDEKGKLLHKHVKLAVGR